MKGGKYFNYIILTIMKTMDTKALTKEYIDNSNILNYRNYRDINSYYYETKEENNRIVESFVDSYFTYFTNNKSELDYWDIEEWKRDVENYEISESVDSYIETNDYKLMNSYQAFEEWIDIDEKNELSISETIKQWQFEGFSELFQSIKEDFIEFLDEKLEDLYDDEEY